MGKIEDDEIATGAVADRRGRTGDSPRAGIVVIDDVEVVGATSRISTAVETEIRHVRDGRWQAVRGGRDLERIAAAASIYAQRRAGSEAVEREVVVAASGVDGNIFDFVEGADECSS